MTNNPDQENRPSCRYQDYVIKDGQLVGNFEEMYLNSADVPWHQDKTAFALFREFDLAIVRHFNAFARWGRVLDVGCGLGHFTARLKASLPEAEVHGIDISRTAIAKAQTLHPTIAFDSADLRYEFPQDKGKFDLVFMADLLWYVLPELQAVFSNVKSLLREDGWIYITQSVPGLPDYYGKNVFPNPSAILDYCSQKFEPRYAGSTYETGSQRLVGVYAVDKYARFLGQLAAAPAVGL